MECAICLAPIVRVSSCVLLCGHAFHVDCTRKLMDSGGKSCPLCRAAFPHNPMKAAAGHLQRLLARLNND